MALRPMLKELAWWKEGKKKKKEEGVKEGYLGGIYILLRQLITFGANSWSVRKHSAYPNKVLKIHPIDEITVNLHR